MIIDQKNLGNEISFLFKKYYFLEDVFLDFCDLEIYEKALFQFKFDFERYFNTLIITKELLYTRVELIGILLYRIAREYFLNGNEIFAMHYSNLGRIISGFEIYYSAKIGKGLKINHGLGTVIGARSVIGENALIHQGVTLGDRNGGRPELLNNVIVYAGAKILGGIICGNNSVIAANSVCLKNVPDCAVVIGIPGKIKI